VNNLGPKVLYEILAKGWPVVMENVEKTNGDGADLFRVCHIAKEVAMAKVTRETQRAGSREQKLQRNGFCCVLMVVDREDKGRITRGKASYLTSLVQLFVSLWLVLS
jgi:hypothetical protein